jgi:hypothetical protein
MYVRYSTTPITQTKTAILSACPHIFLADNRFQLLTYNQEEMRFPSAEVLTMGLDYMGYDVDRQAKLKEATRISYFVSGYGFAPATYVPLFEDLSNSATARAVLKKPPVLSDLLMMANWMKEGITFNSLGGKFNFNPNTSSKWCWAYAEAIAELYDDKVCVFFVCIHIIVTTEQTLTLLLLFLSD